MFWGELFVFLDIRIAGFDLFTDVIGLILIVAGVYQLAAYQEHFDSLRGIVILRMILSLGDIVSVERLGVRPSYTILLSLLLSGVGLALSLLYYYHTLTGIQELASVTLPGLAESAQNRWPPILACNCLGYLFSFLTMLSKTFELLWVIATVAMLVLTISFMELLWRCYKELR